jgi:hypothetical protein
VCFYCFCMCECVCVCVCVFVCVWFVCAAYAASEKGDTETLSILLANKFDINAADMVK